VNKQDGERKGEGSELQINRLHQWAMESQTTHSSKAQKMLNRKQDYMLIGGRNKEGNHKIECPVNKDPLNLMNQQILEYKQ
jgi:hypothetical protein